MFGRNVGKFNNNEVLRENKPRVRANFVKGKSLRCFACDGEHIIFDCDMFKGMRYDQRIKVVKRKRLCFRCLFPGHPIVNCKRNAAC